MNQEAHAARGGLGEPKTGTSRDDWPERTQKAKPITLKTRDVEPHGRAFPLEFHYALLSLWCLTAVLFLALSACVSSQTGAKLSKVPGTGFHSRALEGSPSPRHKEKGLSRAEESLTTWNSQSPTNAYGCAEATTDDLLQMNLTGALPSRPDFQRII